MTKADLLKEMAWEDFTIQTQFRNSYMLILICKDRAKAISLREFISTHLPTIRVSMNTETLQYSIHFFFRNEKESLEYKTGKTDKMYPPLKWLGSGLLQYVTAGYMAAPEQVTAFQPVPLESRTHPN